MKIRICSGRNSYHSDSVLSLVHDSWQTDTPLIFCPPHLEDFGWLKNLPEGELEWRGDFRGPTTVERAGIDYPERPILGVFTSGTLSGSPRLVLYTKAEIESSLSAIMSLFDTKRIRTIFSYAQPFHTFGLLLGYVLSMKLGARLITPEGKYSSRSHLKRIELEDANVLTLGTPTHFYDLLLHAGPEGLAPSYSCIVGGAGVSVGLWRQIQSRLRIEKPSIGYGCTEASPGITHLPPGVEPREDNEIGFPLPSLHARVEPSYLTISGPSLCLGVVDENGADFTSERVIRDSVEARDDGRWVFRGRSDLILNRGGEKFSLERLESVIFSHLGLAALALAVPDPRLGQNLGLLLPNELDHESAFESVRSLLVREFGLRLEREQCCFVAEFPAHASAKPNRREASQRYFPLEAK